MFPLRRGRLKVGKKRVIETRKINRSEGLLEKQYAREKRKGKKEMCRKMRERSGKARSERKNKTER